jgi:transcriptional regulator of acetoin/glycerol metabolism
MNGKTIFARSSRAGCCGGFAGWRVAAQGSIAFCSRDQHGDQLGPARPSSTTTASRRRERERRAIRTLVDARELTIAEIATQYGVSPATIYRRLS